MVHLFDKNREQKTYRPLKCYYFVVYSITTLHLLGHAIVTAGHDPSEEAKLDMWSRGAFDFKYDLHHVGTISSLMIRLGPVSYVRREALAHRNSPHCDVNGYCHFRGGGQDSTMDSETHGTQKIEDLGARFGPAFLEAIEKNKLEHVEDCEKSCEIYYCADPSKPLVPLDTLIGGTTIKSYSMGSVPPEDFAESFG